MLPQAHPPISLSSQTRTAIVIRFPGFPGHLEVPEEQHCSEPSDLHYNSPRAIPYRMSVVWFGLSIMLLRIGHIGHSTELEYR